MNPRGATPQAVMLLDDCLFDAQCSADSQTMNTGSLLECFARIFDDGQVTEHDTEEVLYAFRHVRLEHRFNEDQCSLLKWGRAHCNAVVKLVTGLRGQLQEFKQQLVREG